jgi:oxygen-independent coproporphyrinogen III oxidase
VSSKILMPMIGDFVLDCSQDISLYFHIPFCSKKCPYCHFFVLPNEEKLKISFVEALLKEWELRLPQMREKRIVSIYFGGGTPTKLSLAQFRRILEKIHQSKIPISSGCEVTLETNPEDVTISLMQEFRALGINRVSIGIQSLNDQDLIVLGRTHNAGRGIQAVEAVYEAGISNISIDLMFELPRQTLESWGKCLKKLSNLPLTHLSLYNLTFEPQTVFFKQQQRFLPQLPPDEVRLEMLQRAVQTLESIGLERYEISAFAKPGLHSRHNIGYWTGRPFLGFGPSAFSYWEGARFSNAANLKKYVNELNQDCFPVDFEECLEYPRRFQELLAVQLRLIAGVNMSQFIAKHGPLPKMIEISLQRLIEKRWVEKKGEIVKLTTSGQLFYDSVATELI